MRLRFLLLPFVFAALLTGAASAQDNDVIKVSTQLVSVPVIVTTRDGNYVGDLDKKDFGILEDGVLQPVEFFAAVDEPITLALLIDTSHSTRPVLDNIKSASRALVKLLGPQDRAMVVSFDRDVHVLCELTSDKDKLNKAIKGASIPEPIGTTMRDAIYQTAFTSFAGLGGRKAIIVLTDGEDGGSHITQPKLLLRLQETDILVYPVQFRTERDRVRENILRTGRISARDAAEMSGGHKTRDDLKADAAAEIMKQYALVSAGRFLSSEADQLKPAFESILNELRRQYRLGFYPSDGKSNADVHEIKVRVARPNLIVRARASYRRASSD
jgi:VWFA-related protein